MMIVMDDDEDDGNDHDQLVFHDTRTHDNHDNKHRIQVPHPSGMAGIKYGGVSSTLAAFHGLLVLCSGWG